MKVLSVGEMVIDFLPGTEPDSYIRRAGGAPANVAIALARQDCEAAFCGMLGNDDFGRFLLETLRQNGVRPCVEKLTDEAVTTMTFVSLDAKGDRSFTFVRKPGADMLLAPCNVTDSDLDWALVIHAGSCSLSEGPAAEATRYAVLEGHRRGKLVSFDMNYRNLMWGNDSAAAVRAVQEILPCVDLLKLSEEEAGMLGGEQNLTNLMREYGIALLMETLGGKGARCYWNGRVIEQPGLQADCVDTCGAGDAFWSGFLATLLKAGITGTGQLEEELIEEAMKRGNIAGWLCVQKKGAIESLPYSAEVERYRKELYTV